MALTKLNNQSLAAVTSAGIPVSAGTVISTQQIVNNTPFNYLGSAGGPHNTGYVMPTVTPMATSSKFLMSWNVYSHQNLDNGIDENSFAIYKSVAGGADELVINNLSYIRNNHGSYSDHAHPVTYLDSPNTTSSIVYKLYTKRVNGQMYLGLNGYNQTFIIQEIAG